MPRSSVSTSSIDRSSRSPVARSVTSTDPEPRERGLTVRIVGGVVGLALVLVVVIGRAFITGNAGAEGETPYSLLI